MKRKVGIRSNISRWGFAQTAVEKPTALPGPCKYPYFGPTGLVCWFFVEKSCSKSFRSEIRGAKELDRSPSRYYNRLRSAGPMERRVNKLSGAANALRIILDECIDSASKAASKGEALPDYMLGSLMNESTLNNISTLCLLCMDFVRLGNKLHQGLMPSEVMFSFLLQCILSGKLIVN